MTVVPPDSLGRPFTKIPAFRRRMPFAWIALTSFWREYRQGRDGPSPGLDGRRAGSPAAPIAVKYVCPFLIQFFRDKTHKNHRSSVSIAKPRRCHRNRGPWRTVFTATRPMSRLHRFRRLPTAVTTANTTLRVFFFCACARPMWRGQRLWVPVLAWVPIPLGLQYVWST